jgi:type IV pilus assembly protein PilE
MQRQKGFTLIEIMIAVVIIGILTAVAVPAYSEHVTRTRLAEAFAGLSGMQPSAEQFWANNRSYAGFDRLPPDTANFTYALSNASASAYTVTATGIGLAAGFKFTIDESGKRVTTAVPATPTGWLTKTDCWVDRKGGQCSAQ